MNFMDTLYCSFHNGNKEPYNNKLYGWLSFILD